MHPEEVGELIPEARAEMVDMGVLPGPVYDYKKEKEHVTEFLSRTDPDDLQLVLGSIFYKEDGAFSGAIVQVSNKRLVGCTQFMQVLDEGEIVAMIGRTDTWGEKREGLGEQRLRVINEYTKSRYATRLISLFRRSDEAEGLWKTLVGRGIAKVKRTTQNGVAVYSML
jgi:hypothetical protein